MNRCVFFEHMIDRGFLRTNVHGRSKNHLVPAVKIQPWSSILYHKRIFSTDVTKVRVLREMISVNRSKRYSLALFSAMLKRYPCLGFQFFEVLYPNLELLDLAAKARTVANLRNPCCFPAMSRRK